MNTISTKTYAILLATVVACSPVLASENYMTEMMVDGKDSSVWYKKNSVKVATGLAVAVVGVYALAVYKNKIASPAVLFAGLFCAHKNANKVENTNNEQHENNDENKNESTDSVMLVDQEIILGENQEKNAQLSIYELPAYIKAQEYASHAAVGLKDWMKKGLESNDLE